MKTQLSTNDNLFHDLFRYAQEGIVIHEQGKILDVNDPLAKMFGYQREEMIGLSAKALFTDESFELIKRHIADDSENTYRVEGVRKDGTTFLMVTRARGQVLNGRNVRIATCFDITAEEDLKESEARRLSIIETAKDAIITAGEDRIIVDVNQSALKLFGYPEEELIGQDISLLMPKRFQALHEQGVTRYLNTGKKKVIGTTIEVVAVKRSGEEFPIELSLATGVSRRGTFFSAIIRDISERKKSLEELAFKSMLLDSANDSVIVLDLNGKVLYANEMAHQTRGYSLHEFLDLSINDISTTSSDFKNHISEIRNSNAPAIFEAVHVRKDGTKIHVEVNAQLISHNNQPATLGVVRDISDRNEALNARLASERDLNEAQRITRVGSWSFDIGKGLFDGSHEAYRLFGLPVGIPVSVEEVLEIVHPDDNEHFSQTLRESISSGVPVSDFEYRLMVNGEMRWIQTQIEAEFDGDSHPVKLFGTVKDISDQKEAGLALWASEQRFRGLVETSTECICNIDLEGNFLYMSPAGLESHGMKKVEEVVGKSMTELAEPGYHEILRQTFEAAQKGGAQRFQYESDTLSGIRWFEGILSPQRGPSGEITSFIRISRDITDRINAEQIVNESWESLQLTLEGTVRALASAAGFRDPYTAGHQERVAVLACAIAQEMGITSSKIEGIKVASTLHDIGKMYVPAEILSRPGSLSQFEFELIKSHAMAGYDILKNIVFPWRIADMVLQHHERLDGSGYPRGLSGDAILPEARILSVADVVEAISSRRPYRAGLGINKALEEIFNNRKILYDATAVDACINLFNKKGFDFRDA